MILVTKEILSSTIRDFLGAGLGELLVSLVSAFLELGFTFLTSG